MRRKSNMLLFFFMIGVLSCERVEYYPDKHIQFNGTKLIAHIANDNSGRGGTFEACKQGLSSVDGIEIDLQRTAENTIWISHDLNTITCGNKGPFCFPASIDNDIGGLNACLTAANYYPTLESIFEYVSLHYPNAFISLDCKVWTPCNSGLNVIKQMNEMAQRIIDLVNQYNLQNRIMIESEVGDFLYYFKKNSVGIETYLLTLGDFEVGASRALDAGFTGISFQYSTESISQDLVDLLHRKGLKIQAWTIDDPNQLMAIEQLKVDFIQTDLF